MCLCGHSEFCEECTPQLNYFMEHKFCKHIYGYEEGVDEAWLVYKPKHIIDDGFNIIFKYCPLCGEPFILDLKE